MTWDSLGPRLANSYKEKTFPCVGLPDLANKKGNGTHSSALPGESQGRGSLVGCRPWGRTESDTTEETQQQQQQQTWMAELGTTEVT